jgi:hypothetical protein
MTSGAATAFLGQQGIPAIEVSENDTAAQLLAGCEPRMVLVGTSENADAIGLEMVLAARRAGIESVGVVDSGTNADYRFRGRTNQPLAYAPDWLLLPDPYTRERFVTLGYPPNRVFVCGHPHYDRIRAVGKQLDQRARTDLRQSYFPGAKDRQLVFVFVTEISDGLNPAQYLRSPEYTLMGRGGSDKRTIIVLEEFLDAVQELEPAPYLVVRLHPKEKPDDYEPYLKEFDQISKTERGLEIVYTADLVLGMSSMLMVEAALLGRPTLAILPRLQEKEWLLTARMGITPCVMRREQLRSTLKQWAEDKPRTIAIEERAAVLFGSLERTLAALEHLLRGREACVGGEINET